MQVTHLIFADIAPDIPLYYQYSYTYHIILIIFLVMRYSERKNCAQKRKHCTLILDKFYL